jgi:hypothetical protein
LGFESFSVPCRGFSKSGFFFTPTFAFGSGVEPVSASTFFAFGFAFGFESDVGGKIDIEKVFGFPLFAFGFGADVGGSSASGKAFGFGSGVGGKIASGVAFGSAVAFLGLPLFGFGADSSFVSLARRTPDDDDAPVSGSVGNINASSVLALLRFRFGDLDLGLSFSSSVAMLM